MTSEQPRFHLSANSLSASIAADASSGGAQDPSSIGTSVGLDAKGTFLFGDSVQSVGRSRRLLYCVRLLGCSKMPADLVGQKGAPIDFDSVGAFYNVYAPGGPRKIRPTEVLIALLDHFLSSLGVKGSSAFVLEADVDDAAFKAVSSVLRETHSNARAIRAGQQPATVSSSVDNEDGNGNGGHPKDAAQKAAPRTEPASPSPVRSPPSGANNQRAVESIVNDCKTHIHQLSMRVEALERHLESKGDNADRPVESDPALAELKAKMDGALEKVTAELRARDEMISGLEKRIDLMNEVLNKITGSPTQPHSEEPSKRVSTKIVPQKAKPEQEIIHKDEGDPAMQYIAANKQDPPENILPTTLYIVDKNGRNIVDTYTHVMGTEYPRWLLKLIREDCGDSESILVLNERGNDMSDGDGKTVFMRQVESGPDHMRYFSRHTNMDMQDRFGWTAMMLWIKTNKSEAPTWIKQRNMGLKNCWGQSVDDLRRMYLKPQ